MLARGLRASPFVRAMQVPNRTFVRSTIVGNKEIGDIIGIDLGTTNSCVAIMEGKNPRVIECL